MDDHELEAIDVAVHDTTTSAALPDPTWQVTKYPFPSPPPFLTLIPTALSSSIAISTPQHPNFRHMLSKQAETLPLGIYLTPTQYDRINERVHAFPTHELKGLHEEEAAVP